LASNEKEAYLTWDAFERNNVAGTIQSENPPKRANIEEGGRRNIVLSNRGARRVSESGTPFLGIVKAAFDNRKANLFLASGEIWMTE
jgi:hypothetical protein